MASFLLVVFPLMLIFLQGKCVVHYSQCYQSRLVITVALVYLDEHYLFNSGVILHALQSKQALIQFTFALEGKIVRRFKTPYLSILEEQQILGIVNQEVMEIICVCQTTPSTLRPTDQATRDILSFLEWSTNILQFTLTSTIPTPPVQFASYKAEGLNS